MLYWNKELFKEAGLDPEKAPANWAEMVEFAEKLTKRDASGNVTQWGVQIPSSGFPYWLFQGLTTPTGAILMNEAGTETYFDKPEVIEALQYWVDLSRKHKVHPPGIVEWGTTPKDFFEKKAAMMWTTTGNLTNVRANAKFPFGVACCRRTSAGQPDRRRQLLHLQEGDAGRAGGGASSSSSGSPRRERAAQWSIDTGYVAVTPAAYDTAGDEEVRAGLPPALVARDQLQYAVAELSTHENQRVTKALNDGLQAALTGTKTPEQAMKDAQREAERILKRLQALTLPAAAGMSTSAAA